MVSVYWSTNKTFEKFFISFVNPVSPTYLICKPSSSQPMNTLQLLTVNSAAVIVCQHPLEYFGCEFYIEWIQLFHLIKIWQEELKLYLPMCTNVQNQKLSKWMETPKEWETGTRLSCKGVWATQSSCFVTFSFLH